ncbi:MAG: tetratricopeptide repeat protein [Haloferacaceae archaeon]
MSDEGSDPDAGRGPPAAGSSGDADGGGQGSDGDRRSHDFSAGQGIDEGYEEFTLDPEIATDPGQVDPVDSRALADLLDERQIAAEDVDAEALLDVGLSYVGIRRYEEATETLERAARFAESEGIEQEAWINKGAAHAELEEYDAAIGAYREALAIDDESAHAASAETNLAYALWEFGHTEEALSHAERAVEVDPRFPQAWYNRGFFLNERGLHEDAKNALDNAIRLGMRNAEVLDEKARALDELGEREEAEAVHEQAEELRAEAERELVEERGARPEQGEGLGGASRERSDPRAGDDPTRENRHRE